MNLVFFFLRLVFFIRSLDSLCRLSMTLYSVVQSKHPSAGHSFLESLQRHIERRFCVMFQDVVMIPSLLKQSHALFFTMSTRNLQISLIFAFSSPFIVFSQDFSGTHFHSFFAWGNSVERLVVLFLPPSFANMSADRYHISTMPGFHWNTTRRRIILSINLLHSNMQWWLPYISRTERCSSHHPGIEPQALFWNCMPSWIR